MENLSTRHITGIHHITALAGSARKNLDFFQGILGLRLIKKTVNFDDPGVYHLYYGDYEGNPGSILTFFPYEGIRRGRHGTGLVNTTSFSVPFGSIAYWENRFNGFGIPFKNVQERFGDEAFMYFEDTDGLGLELVFNDLDKRPPISGGEVPGEYAIRGFFGAEIWAAGSERTAALLMDKMDHEIIKEAGSRIRLAAKNEPGHFIDLLVPATSTRGLNGGGTVHHIAFATPKKETQLKAWHAVKSHGLDPTPFVDRQYFRSIYFREPGGVLFEVATNGPGFAIDEPLEALGRELKLPPQYESRREAIASQLPPLEDSTKSL